MNTKEVDVGDDVIVTRGDWQGQIGHVETKYDPPDVLKIKQPPLLTIRLKSFGKTITKRSVDVEKTIPTS